MISLMGLIILAPMKIVYNVLAITIGVITLASCKVTMSEKYYKGGWEVESMKRAGDLVSNKGMLKFSLDGNLISKSDSKSTREQKWEYLDEEHIVIDHTDTLEVKSWDKENIVLYLAPENLTITLQRSKTPLEKYNDED